MILSCGYCSETEDGWHVMIQDAILEKCIENGAGVVHIAVDKSSSEVYCKVICIAECYLRPCLQGGRVTVANGLTLAGGQKIARVYKQNFTGRVTLQPGTT